jgi:hypothetical protein
VEIVILNKILPCRSSSSYKVLASNILHSKSGWQTKPKELRLVDEVTAAGISMSKYFSASRRNTEENI